MTLPRVAVVGSAESDFGRLSGVTALELHVQAASRALADAGLTKDRSEERRVGKECVP